MRPEGLCRPEIDDQLEPGRQLHRYVRRLCPFENLVDQRCAAPLHVRKARPIRKKAACDHELAQFVDGWQVLLGREVDDPLAMLDCSNGSASVMIAAVRPLTIAAKAGSNATRSCTPYDWQRHADGGGGLFIACCAMSTMLGFVSFQSMPMGVKSGTTSRRISSRLALSSGARFAIPVMSPWGCARLGDQADTDWVAHADEYHRDRRGSALSRERRRRATDLDHIHVERDQFGGELVEPIGLPLCPPNFENEVAPLHITKLAQAVAKCAEEWVGCHPGLDNADATHLPRRLGARSERPSYRRATGPSYEIASPHLCAPEAEAHNFLATSTEIA